MENEIVHIGSLPESVHVSDVGITFSADIDFDQWYRLMMMLQRLETAFQFGIGDVLNYGSIKYGEKYSQAMSATGYAYQSLANWAWVSKSVPIENRMSGLSWTHHRIVASLPVTEQAGALAMALANDMSVGQFKDEINGIPEKKEVPSKTVEIPDGWTVDDVNKALELISKSPVPVADVYEAGLLQLSQEETKVQRYCAECPYNN